MGDLGISTEPKKVDLRRTLVWEISPMFNTYVVYVEMMQRDGRHNSACPIEVKCSVHGKFSLLRQLWYYRSGEILIVSLYTYQMDTPEYSSKSIMHR
jgi:hypothetical protein